MKYLTPEEIRTEDSVKERLSHFNGPVVKTGFALEVLRRYHNKFINRQDIRVLDCGAASGAFLKNLWDAGYKDLYAVDIDDYFEPGHKKLLRDFRALDLSFKSLPWPDNFFDILTGWCLLPHLENPHQFIREAYRVLNKNGLLIISLVNINSKLNRKYFFNYGNFPGYHENNNHISLFTPAIFKKTILKYFDLVGTEYFLNPRIFIGFKGRIRKAVYRLFKARPVLMDKIEARWGPKIIYILQKKNENLLSQS